MTALGFLILCMTALAAYVLTEDETAGWGFLAIASVSAFGVAVTL